DFAGVAVLVPAWRPPEVRLVFASDCAWASRSRIRAPRPPPPGPAPGLPPPPLGLPDAGLTDEPPSSSTDAPPTTATDGPMYRRTAYCCATVHRFVVIQ